MTEAIRIGDLSIPVYSDNLIELVNQKRQWLRQPPLPPDMTQDSLKISFNSIDFDPNLINITFLGHLERDILIPYPSNAWMGSVLPAATFAEVHSVNYYQQINGDCELTHAMEDLARIVKVGGKAVISVPNFRIILGKIVETTSDSQRLKWEHFLFSRNVDERGLYFNQSVCDINRLRSRASYAGFRKVVEDTTYGVEYEKYLTMEADSFDLPGVTPETREEHKKMLEDPKVRRKKCIVPRCDSKAGQKELQRAPSVYCRRHYRKAKAKLAEAQERALRLVVVLEKVAED